CSSDLRTVESGWSSTAPDVRGANDRLGSLNNGLTFSVGRSGRTNSDIGAVGTSAVTGLCCAGCVSVSRRLIDEVRVGQCNIAVFCTQIFSDDTHDGINVNIAVGRVVDDVVKIDLITSLGMY